MAWKCPNCETINQGKSCIVCGMAAPGIKENTEKKKIKPGVIVLIALVTIAATAAVIGIALSKNSHPELPGITETENIDTEDIHTETVSDETDEYTEIPETDNAVTTDPPVTEPVHTEQQQETVKETERPTETHPVNEIISVHLDKSDITLNAGESVRLNGSIRRRGEVDNTVTWKSSDTKVAMVTSEGTVIGVYDGKCVITMTAVNGMTADCSVTVKSVAVKSVALSESSIIMSEGGTARLTASFNPSNATDKKIKWVSSDEGIVKITADGNSAALKAGKAGSAIVTATSSNGKSAKCSITVESKTVEANSVKLDKTSLTVTVGDSIKLSCTVSPENTSDKSVVWSTSDGSIAKVDKDGNIKALKSGTAVITVKTKNGKSAKCTVNVKSAEPTGITLSDTKVTLEVGNTRQINAEIKPESAKGSTISWKTSDEKIVTCKDGMLKAVGIGDAVVTAELKNGIKAECSVTVNKAEVRPQAIFLDKEQMTLVKDKTYTFNVALYPSDASEKFLNWQSSDEKIITVSNNGTVTALNEGIAAVTVTAGENISAICVIRVIDNSDGIKNLFDYTKNEYGVTITAYKGSEVNLKIPDMIDDLPVIAIGDKVFSGKNIQSVILPAGLLAIGDSAFEYCPDLRSISLPDGLMVIGKRAFAATGLTEIDIPSSVYDMGSGAFADNVSMKAVNVAEGNQYYLSQDGLVFSRDWRTLHTVPAGFSGGINIGYVKTITPYAFSGCIYLSSVQFDDSLTDIGNGAFQGCLSLNTVILPDTVSSMGEDAFAYCVSLVEFKVPLSVKSLESGVFAGCTSLSRLYVESNVEWISNNAFDGGSRGLTIIAPENTAASMFALLRGYAYEKK